MHRPQKISVAEEQTAKTTTKVSVGDQLFGYLGLAVLVGGTARAIQLEAHTDARNMVYVGGAIVIAFAMHAVWKIVRK